MKVCGAEVSFSLRHQLLRSIGASIALSAEFPSPENPHGRALMRAQ